MILALAAALALQPGIYTNEEQVYFAGEGGKPKLQWLGLAVGADGSARRVDAFGNAMSGALPSAATPTVEGYDTTLGNETLHLQRARAWTCWASVPRRALKNDKPDWWFKPGLALHDRGGRADVVTDETPPQHFTLRMRNVVWPSGPNQPSVVLYVHDDDPDRAIAYSWADPEAKRVGINLRTVQASCSLTP